MACVSSEVTVLADAEHPEMIAQAMQSEDTDSATMADVETRSISPPYAIFLTACY